MIVDSSAFLAMILGEPEQDDFQKKILTAPKAMMSVANYLEVCLKLERCTEESGHYDFDEYFFKTGIELVPVSLEQAKVACRANRIYGRGSGHKAKLNFGDCFAYALAKDSNMPLLFKGDDFVHTDIEQA